MLLEQEAGWDPPTPHWKHLNLLQPPAERGGGKAFPLKGLEAEASPSLPLPWASPPAAHRPAGKPEFPGMGSRWVNWCFSP